VVKTCEAYPETEAGERGALGVDALAVTPNEDLVIIANAVYNDIDFYTIPNLEKVKTYKGKLTLPECNYKNSVTCSCPTDLFIEFLYDYKKN
jgi:hypothetical protein